MIKKNGERIGIIGGHGQMGGQLCRKLQEKGCDVIVSDVETSLSNTRLASLCDIVIVSVPIRSTYAVLEEVAPHMRPNALLTDLTSVKTFPLEAMRTHSKNNVAYMGGHPLFAPQSQWDGQHFIICTGRENERSQQYRSLLTSLGVTIIEMSAEEHDRHMAVIQCLTHFSNLALGHTLHTLNYDLATGEKISTAVYRMRLYGVGRILAQDPVLYADIQRYNPYAKAVTAQYARAVDDLLHAIDHDDERSFGAIFARSKMYFGSLSQRSQRITDALITAMRSYE
jgi:prephenate dehydrogenase